jgi:hypothetical protein
LLLKLSRPALRNPAVYDLLLPGVRFSRSDYHRSPSELAQQALDAYNARFTHPHPDGARPAAHWCFCDPHMQGDEVSRQEAARTGMGPSPCDSPCWQDCGCEAEALVADALAVVTCPHWGRVWHEIDEKSPPAGR